MNQEQEDLNKNSDNMENENTPSNSIPTNPNLKTNENTSLEENIINIEIPPEAFKTPEAVVEPIPNATSIPEVEATIEKSEAPSKDSVMVEKKIESDTGNSKGVTPVLIIFGFFIILLIAFPYISDYVGRLDEERKNEEFEQYKEQFTTPTSTPTPTPDIEIENSFDELYNSCGTEEVFTNITIDYNVVENQCFKININHNKNFIKYVPAISENSTKWSIYLGEKEIYTNEANTNRIRSIQILSNGTIEMQEMDALGNLTHSYHYDSTGNLIDTSENQP